MAITIPAGVLTVLADVATRDAPGMVPYERLAFVTFLPDGRLVAANRTTMAIYYDYALETESPRVAPVAIPAHMMRRLMSYPSSSRVPIEVSLARSSTVGISWCEDGVQIRAALPHQSTYVNIDAVLDGSRSNKIESFSMDARILRILVEVQESLRSLWMATLVHSGPAEACRWDFMDDVQDVRHATVIAMPLRPAQGEPTS
jgi:hypothetical protein